jgi:hypothetical protein
MEQEAVIRADLDIKKIGRNNPYICGIGKNNKN